MRDKVHKKESLGVCLVNLSYTGGQPIMIIFSKKEDCGHYSNMHWKADGGKTFFSLICLIIPLRNSYSQTLRYKKNYFWLTLITG